MLGQRRLEPELSLDAIVAQTPIGWRCHHAMHAFVGELAQLIPHIADQRAHRHGLTPERNAPHSCNVRNASVTDSTTAYLQPDSTTESRNAFFRTMPGGSDKGSQG